MKNSTDRKHTAPRVTFCHYSLKRPSPKLFKTCLLLLAEFPVLLLNSCSKSENQIPAQQEEKKISCTFNIINRFEWVNLKNCDIFLYTPTGTRNLLQHIHIDGLCNEFLQSLNAEIPECGEALGVCIFNCPFQFNMKAVDRMDSMEQLVFKYEDDSPSSPLCSARFEFDPDSEMTLEPKPLMSRIILESISNGLDKYRLLEEPVIYLGNAGSSARVFQEEEFRPKEVITKPGRIKLPHDIGFYTQYPETVLFCYPNDTPENILGQERTELLFECVIEGKSKCYTIGLPPIPRAATIKVDLIIDGEEKYYSHFS